MIQPFSPIDEAAHLDYIYYIFDKNELPLMGNFFNSDLLSEVGKVYIPQFQNHEFFQPPLYYLLTSSIFFIFSNKIRNNQ